MNRRLALSPDLALPMEAAAQVIALVGIRGSGKTNSAGVIAEELLDRGQQVVFIDPTDGAWGMRSHYPIFIFGGPHGDIPLGEHDGKTMAEFVVGERVPLILSLRHLRKSAQRHFVTEFCEDLYHLKGRDQYRSPLTVIIDEAPLFVPQRVMGETARVVGAIEDLCARGRNTGFGVILITQRPATVNKDVLSQADTIIAHRIIGPQDRKALAEWLEENASEQDLKALLASLATMPNGRAWVWAPLLGIMKQVQIRKRKTFDSSATPKMGQRVQPPKKLHEVDLGSLQAKLAANVERAKTEDPKLLQAEIRKLRSELGAEQTRRRAALATKPVVTKIPAGLVHAAHRLEQALIQAKVLHGSIMGLAEDLDRWDKRLTGSISTIEHLAGALMVPQRPPAPPPSVPVLVEGPHGRSLVEVPAADLHSVGSPPSRALDQRILDALAWWRAAGFERPTRSQVAFVAGRTIGGHFNNTVSRLHTQGLVAYPGPGTLALTEAGMSQVRPVTGPTTRAALIAMLREQLGHDLKRRIFDALVDADKPLDREALSIRVGRTEGGHFNNSVSRLSGLGLVHYPGRGLVELSPAVTALP